MVPIGYAEARGTQISEKNLMSKILCQTPFQIDASIWSWSPILIKVKDAEWYSYLKG